MDKGIRPECNRKFRELLPTRENTRAGNTAFRKTVMCHIMEAFGITLASAATHYNHAFIDARKAAETDTTLATQLEGLGRPEDKKGGRKKKAVVEVDTRDPVVFAAFETKAQHTARMQAEVAATGELLSEGVKENTSEQTVTVNPAAEAAPEAPVQKFSVCKAGDKTVVCSDLTLEEANALIEKAAKAKKAKLELVA